MSDCPHCGSPMMPFLDFTAGTSTERCQRGCTDRAALREAIRERDAAEFMRDQAEVAVAELAEIHEAMMDDWMSRESMTAAECVRRLIGERDAARKERDRAHEALRRIESMAGIPPGWEGIADVTEDDAWSCADDYYVHRENMRRIARAALDPSPSPEPPITGVTETK